MKNNSKTSNKLYWVYLIGFFLILALPLLNLPPWFSPPDWGKTIVFRIILAIMVFVFLWQFFYQKENIRVFSRKVSRGFAIKVLIALLGIYFLATLFSLDIRFSLWGSPYRSGGFVNFAFYIIFAILLLLILRQKDWQKIWVFSIFIGVLVSLVAIFQNFSIFSQIFTPRKIEIVSTVGLPLALGIYLLLLGFLTFSFFLKEKKLWKKFFYLISFFFLFFGIALSHSQATYLGAAVAFVWFLFFYDSGGIKKIILLKIIAAILIIVGFGGLYFLKTHPKNPLSKNSIISALTSWGIGQSRISAWKVSFQAIKNKPILGYGPENFNIGFDKYYDPSLPKIEKDPGFHSSWWDRAHSFVFDIAVTAGVPALIIYLLLFGTLFWQLQKLKKRDTNIRMHTNDTNTQIIAHGIQATFIGYFVANFFSFDTFSTYLLSFLLIAYSLHLLENADNLRTTPEALNHAKQYAKLRENFSVVSRPISRSFAIITRYKKLSLFLLFLCLVWFNWQYNIKPFQINTQINIANYLVANNKCEQALARMDKILEKKSFLDHYLRLEYAEIINDCIKKMPEEKITLSQKVVQLLKENIKIRSYYVRDWLGLGEYANILIEHGQTELKEKANYYFERANQLSPKRQEVFLGWVKNALITGQYEKAIEKSQKCIDSNPNLSECWWLAGLSQAYSGNFDKANHFIKIAQEKGYDINSKNSILQLINAYIINKDYQGLVELYTKLITLEPQNPQYHASLAFAYRELGQIKKAREEALIVLELMPEAREEVEIFLKELP